MQEDCANKLSDPSTWDLFLPYIYSVLSKIANEIYNNKYPKNDNDETIRKRYISAKAILLDEFYEYEVDDEDEGKFFEHFIVGKYLKILKIKAVEIITSLLLAQAVYLVSKNRLFNNVQFNIQGNFNFNGQIISAINKHVNDVFYSLLRNSKVESLKDTIYEFLDSVENSTAITTASTDIVMQYLINNLQYSKDEQLRRKFCSVSLKIICLSNYNLKIERFGGIASFSAVLASLFSIIGRPGLIYGSLFGDLNNHGNLLSFVLGEGSYHIFNIKQIPDFHLANFLYNVVIKILKTKEEKVKFATWFYGEEKSKEEKEAPKPNLEKQNSKDLSNEFNPK